MLAFAAALMPRGRLVHATSMWHVAQLHNTARGTWAMALARLQACSMAVADFSPFPKHTFATRAQAAEQRKAFNDGGRVYVSGQGWPSVPDKE